MPSTPDWLPDFVRSRMAEEAARNEGAARGIAEAQGMTLFGTIGFSSHLRPDGSVWIHDEVDCTAEPTVWRWRHAATREALGAIKVAAERVPELMDLLPTKPDGTPPCETCQGSGHLTRADGATCPAVLCDSCYGLGWLVQEDGQDA